MRIVEREWYRTEHKGADAWVSPVHNIDGMRFAARLMRNFPYENWKIEVAGQYNGMGEVATVEVAEFPSVAVRNTIVRDGEAALARNFALKDMNRRDGKLDV